MASSLSGGPVTPTVTVIVIFLDEERFLQEALDSVLDQTFGDWELLLVDDGSTDRSAAIAEDFARRHPDRVRYLTHQARRNRGMSASRNLGVRHARGQFISYLDGDDVWVPEKLEEQVALLELHPRAAMAYGPLELWYSWTGLPEHRDADHHYGVYPNGRQPFRDVLVEPPDVLCLFLEDEDFLPGGVLVRRDVLVAVGGGDEGFRDAYEDAVVLTKICLSHPVYVAARSWYRYRQHPDSASKRAIARGQENEERRTFLRWVAGYLAAQESVDPRVLRSLGRAQWRYERPLRHRLRSLRRQIRYLETWRRLARRSARRIIAVVSPGSAS